MIVDNLKSILFKSSYYYKLLWLNSSVDNYMDRSYVYRSH